MKSLYKFFVIILFTAAFLFVITACKDEGELNIIAGANGMPIVIETGGAASGSWGQTLSMTGIAEYPWWGTLTGLSAYFTYAYVYPQDNEFPLDTIAPGSSFYLNNNNVSLTLNPVDQSFLTEVSTLLPQLYSFTQNVQNLSVTNGLKALVIAFFLYEPSIFFATLEKVTHDTYVSVHFVYSNMDGNVSGSTVIQDGWNTYNVNVNVRLKAGWNTLLVTEPYYSDTITIQDGKPDSSFKWYID